MSASASTVSSSRAYTQARLAPAPPWSPRPASALGALTSCPLSARAHFPSLVTDRLNRSSQSFRRGSRRHSRAGAGRARSAPSSPWHAQLVAGFPHALLLLAQRVRRGCTGWDASQSLPAQLRRGATLSRTRARAFCLSGRTQRGGRSARAWRRFRPNARTQEALGAWPRAPFSRCGGAALRRSFFRDTRSTRCSEGAQRCAAPHKGCRACKRLYQGAQLPAKEPQATREAHGREETVWTQ